MTDPQPLEKAEVDVPAVLAAQVNGQSAPDPQSMSQAMAAAFGTLREFMQRCSLSCGGPPRTIYTAYGPQGVTFTVAMPLAGPPASVPQGGPVTVGTITGKRALRFTHRGPYHELMQTYNRITQFMQAEGMITSQADWARYMPMWEEYLNDPRTTPEADLLTYLYVPLG